MEQHLNVHDINLTDLSVYQCGKQDCDPDYSYGPAIRDHFLIHYILEGEGIFQSGDKTYKLKKNQGFLICPEQIAYYRASSTNPWLYTWVGFNGEKAQSYLDMAGLGMRNPIFTCTNDIYIQKCFQDMLITGRMGMGKEIRLTGILYMLLSQLVETLGPVTTSVKTLNRNERYVSKAIEFIQHNFSRDIKISEISSSMNLDRSYLGSIFKNIIKTSPQEYLIYFRMDRACHLLGSNEPTIGDVSRSVGYQDPMLFSKMFRKTLGLSPSQYRKKFQAGIL